MGAGDPAPRRPSPPGGLDDPEDAEELLQVPAPALGELCRAAVRTLTVHFEALAGEEIVPGMVVAVQTSGDRIHFHPHLHLLVTEGGIDREGIFHRQPRLDDARLAEIFGREVLRLLVDRGLLSPEWVERILSWRHTGFHVHSRVRARTKTEAERIGKYMVRPVLALERLSFLEREGKVGYRHGPDGEELDRMDYLELIARVTSRARRAKSTNSWRSGEGSSPFFVGHIPDSSARSSARRQPGGLNFEMLTSARGFDTLFVVMGRLDRESAVRDFTPSAKRNFLSFRDRLLQLHRPQGRGGLTGAAGQHAIETLCIYTEIVYAAG
ncbi:MAG: transposase [Candidatus Aminicenantales bacterium]